MLLVAGDFDEIDLPGVVGAYVLNSRPDYELSCIEALKAIRDDSTLSAITSYFPEPKRSG